MSASPHASSSALPAAASPPASPVRRPLAPKPTKAGSSSSKPKPKPKPKAPSPGIVYISRIPPGMTPHKIKHLMARWGATGKVFAQKDTAAAAAAAGKGKAHSVNYTEAWIEFLDKAVAKNAAAMFNAQPIGGHKGEKWRDDIWTMKYLPGFKWTMLGEQMAYERNSHQARLRQELAKSKAEQAAYLASVDLAKSLEKRREKALAAGKPLPAKRGREEEKDAAAAGEGEGEGRQAGGAGREGDKRKKRKLKAVEAKRQEGERKLEDVLGSVF